MNYQRVKPAKVADVIVEQLEGMILEGSLSPGERLPSERDLAKQFEVSRPSLREAIQKLEAKNLVFRRQGGGTYIQASLQQGLTDPLFRLLLEHEEGQLDLLEFRHAFEGISAYYAALRGTKQDIDKVEHCYQQILEAQQAEDLPREVSTVVDFHIAITEASHNLVLFHLIRGLRSLLEKNILENLQQLYKWPQAAAEISHLRAQLLQAIVAREPREARDASHRHLAYIEDVLLKIDREGNRQDRSNRRLMSLTK